MDDIDYLDGHPSYKGKMLRTINNKKKKKLKFRKFEDPKSETESLPPLRPAIDPDATDENTSDLELDVASTAELTPEVRNGELNNAIDRLQRVSKDSMIKAPPDLNISPEDETIPDKQKQFVEVVRQESGHYEMEDDIWTGDSSKTEIENSLLQEINTNALPKEAPTYELEKFKKNVLIIFNHENIDGYDLPRYGTEKDVAALTNTFENFGFEVVEHKDYTKDAVFKELKTFSERNFTDYGCVAVAVLTHGSNKGVLRAKDDKYSEIEIINHFKVLNKPTLVTKPKIIIIQACRGPKIVPGVPVFRSGKVRLDHDEELEPYILPVESDILILHSSYGGSPSHRDEVHGSWFIQELCSKINFLAGTHDLESIITEVKREVAINKQHEEYNKRTLEWDVNKQMPVVTSTLIRKLYLRKFGEVPGEEETFADMKRLSVSCDARNEVLDSAVASTPLLVQFGPCSCFLDHFNYMRNCLRYFLEENPDDVTALSLLDVANTFEEGIEFNTSKERMSKAISNHLFANARGCHYFKYLYFYKQ